jgi:hypothetical protein
MAKCLFVHCFVQAHGEVSSPRCSQRVIRFQRISAASHNRRWCPLAPDADGRGVGSGVAQRQVRRCVGGRHVWGGVVWMVERLGCCHQIDQTISPCRRNSTRVRLAWPIPTTFDGISCVCNARVRFHKYHILRVFSCILTRRHVYTDTSHRSSGKTRSCPVHSRMSAAHSGRFGTAMSFAFMAQAPLRMVGCSRSPS